MPVSKGVCRLTSQQSVWQTPPGSQIMITESAEADGSGPARLARPAPSGPAAQGRPAGSQCRAGSQAAGQKVSAVDAWLTSESKSRRSCFED